MPAYVVVSVEVKDPVRYEDYKRMVPPSLQAYGGRFIVRGGAAETLEGEGQPGRIVVLEFPDLAAARRFYASPEYQAILIPDSAIVAETTTIDVTTGTKKMIRKRVTPRSR